MSVERNISIKQALKGAAAGFILLVACGRPQPQEITPSPTEASVSTASPSPTPEYRILAESGPFIIREIPPMSEFKQIRDIETLKSHLEFLEGTVSEYVNTGYDTDYWSTVNNLDLDKNPSLTENFKVEEQDWGREGKYTVYYLKWPNKEAQAPNVQMEVKSGPNGEITFLSLNLRVDEELKMTKSPSYESSISLDKLESLSKVFKDVPSQLERTSWDPFIVNNSDGSKTQLAISRFYNYTSPISDGSMQWVDITGRTSIAFQRHFQ